MERKTVVFNRSYFDVATGTGHIATLKYGIKFCESNNIPFVDLYATQAIKRVFNSKMGPKTLLFDGCGHGLPRQHMGQNNDVLLDLDNPADLQLMQGIAISPLTCSFGEWAEAWIAAGIPVFSGYKLPFIFSKATQANDDAEGLSYHEAHYIWLQTYLLSVLYGKPDPGQAQKDRYDAFTALAEDTWNPITKIYYLYDRDISLTHAAAIGGMLESCMLPNAIRTLLKCPYSVS